MERQKISIAKLVIFSLVVVTSLVLTAFGIAYYYIERTARLDGLRTEIEGISEQLAIGLALPRWNLDSEQVGKIIESAMLNSQVYGVIVKTSDGSQVVSGRIRDKGWRVVPAEKGIPAKGLLSEKAEITYSGKQIGTVTVYATTRFVEDALKDFLIKIAVSVLTLNACLVAMIYILLNHTVLKPLMSVEGYTQNVTAGKGKEAYIQERGFFGELNRLRNCVLEMTNSLLHAQNELEYNNERLRKEVEERKAVEMSLRKSEERFRGLLESAADGMVIVNERHEIVMVNAQLEKMLGYDRSELVGRDIGILIPLRFARHQEFADDYLKHPSMRFMGEGEELFALRKDGSEFPVEVSLSPIETPEGMIISAAVRDITRRKRYEAQLQYLAGHDGLTDLPNRNLLADRIRQALIHARRHRREVAVLFVDLDHFKFINDSLGHEMGDRLLKIIAGRLVECVRSGDTVARQGSDVFVVTLSDLADSEDAAKVARKIQVAVNRPIKLDAHELEITCSIGISVFPRDGKEARDLLKNADVALFRAKEQGGSNFEFFTTEMNDRVVARMTLEKHLRRALERDEFLLHYQPQVDLNSGRVIGVEALIRWQSPDMGVVSPADFIPLAEETGLIVPIGEWVLRTACGQNRKWQDEGLPRLVISVNLSPRQFRQKGLAEMVALMLRETGLEARYLELEVTESLVMHDVEIAAAVLEALRKLGVRLAMDDFGTGYSSLGYLKRFPFEKLKIDRSFVNDITTNPDSAAIASAMIALGHSLNLQVIAEGVETEGQLAYLRFHACDGMQGYYFSRPLPAADFAQLLRDGQRLQLAGESGRPAERTLLIVDDEPDVIAALERVFADEGYRILSAAKSEQGLELLALYRVGVAICDVRIPGMNGIELLERVRDMYPETIRIALSGYADLMTVLDAFNSGVVYKFLTKPWDDKVLRHRISEAFLRHELKGVMRENGDRRSETPSSRG